MTCPTTCALELFVSPVSLAQLVARLATKVEVHEEVENFAETVDHRVPGAYYTMAQLPTVSTGNTKSPTNPTPDASKPVEVTTTAAKPADIKTAAPSTETSTIKDSKLKTTKSSNDSRDGKRIVSVALPEKLAKQLRLLCATTGQTAQHVIESALKRAISKQLGAAIEALRPTSGRADP